MIISRNRTGRLKAPISDLASVQWPSFRVSSVTRKPAPAPLCTSHLPLHLRRSPLNRTLPFPACGFITYPACICMCIYDLSHLPEDFRESALWHLTTNSKPGSDSDASYQIGYVFICSIHTKLAHSGIILMYFKDSSGCEKTFICYLFSFNWQSSMIPWWFPTEKKCWNLLN